MNRLKELRLSKNMTQQQVADVLGVSRRTIQNLEKDAANTKSDKFDYYVKLLESFKPASYFTDIVIGDNLNNLIDLARNYRKRYCYKYLLDYLTNDYRGKVCILYGLRRTGKTTLICQAIKELDNDNCAYIKAKESNTMADLIKDINKLKDDGVKYLFIDEITLIEDFINTAAVLSDVYSAMGMKIVLSGTDSLGFIFASNDELYDRNVMIHTSYISFREFSYVLGIDDIDKYIEYGGTFKMENMGFDVFDYKNDDVSFRNDESTRKYIDTAIVRNIQKSLQNDRFGSRFAHLKELHESGELTNAINRIIEDMNHDFLLSVVTKAFKSHDLGSSRQILTHSENEDIQTSLYVIDEVEVLKKLKDILDIKEKEELNVQLTQAAVNQINEYLFALDLIKEVNIRYGDGAKGKRVVFSQPGMRYSITKALVYSLLQDNAFNLMKEKDKLTIIETILNDVKGRMLEDIVLLEVSIKERNETVFKFIDHIKGEYDMVIYHPNDDISEIYEIKHSKSISFTGQTKNLTDKDLEISLEKFYGKISNRNILYRGLDKDVNNIKYRNVEQFLKTL